MRNIRKTVTEVLKAIWLVQKVSDGKECYNVEDYTSSKSVDEIMAGVKFVRIRLVGMEMRPLSETW